jgi:hypothetical protein
MVVTALMVGVVVGVGVVGFAMACCTVASRGDARAEETRRRQSLWHKELL